MKCEIIKDLLPSYVDGLTSEETNKEVEEHIQGCSDCSRMLQDMRTPEKPFASNKKEVDYLKKVRRRNIIAAILCVVITACIVAIVVCYPIFIKGSKVSLEGMNYNLVVSDKEIIVNGKIYDNNFSRVEFSEVDGTVSVQVFSCPRSPFGKQVFQSRYTASETVKTVKMGKYVIWEDGMQISEYAATLLEAYNPYVGNMPANADLATLRNFSDKYGKITSSLVTSSEPYGWNVEVEREIKSGEEETIQNNMMEDSCILLATIENLDYMNWIYIVQGEKKEFKVTVEDADHYVGVSVKEVGKSASGIQNLLDKLNQKWSDWSEVQMTGNFTIHIINASNKTIYGYNISYFIGDTLISSGGAINADFSKIQKGDEMVFDVSDTILSEQYDAYDLKEFSFSLSVVDKDGNETPVADRIPLRARFAWAYYFYLNSEDGNLILR